MRGYWFRILLGAVGIFAVGMLIVTAVRATKAKVQHVVQSSEPLSFPLPFVPFRLDGERVGTFERVVINRDAPDDVRSVDLHVDLGSVAAADRTHRCTGIRAILHPGPGGEGQTLHDAEFACVEGDSGTEELEELGEVHFVPGDHTAPLLVPPQFATKFRREMIQMRARRGDDSLAVRAESMAAAAERTADSIGEAAGRMADSITRYHERYAESIRRAALRRADSAMRRRERKE
jgi:hypothetical protein